MKQIRDRETGRYQHEWAYAPEQDIPGVEIAECQTCPKVRVHASHAEPRIYKDHATAIRRESMLTTKVSE